MTSPATGPIREAKDFRARYLDENRAAGLVDLFLKTEFAGGRHARRVAKLEAVERDLKERAEEREP